MDKTEQKIIHGSALEIFGSGVIIIGTSGSGKSELSLRLINRKHKFIADDQVLIKQDTADSLWIHQNSTNFLHLGGIGFIDVLATYGRHAVMDLPTKCNLFIELKNSVLDCTDRINELSSSLTILGQKVPLYTLYIAQNRPLELLVEVLVKKQQQLDNGYNANKAFINTINNLSKT